MHGNLYTRCCLHSDLYHIINLIHATISAQSPLSNQMWGAVTGGYKNYANYM